MIITHFKIEKKKDLIKIIKEIQMDKITSKEEIIIIKIIDLIIKIIKMDIITTSLVKDVL